MNIAVDLGRKATKQTNKQNVPPGVRLYDTLISLKLHCYPLFHFFSNAMHACIYVHITVRLFLCFIILVICAEGHMVDWPSS